MIDSTINFVRFWFAFVKIIELYYMGASVILLILLLNCGWDNLIKAVSIILETIKGNECNISKP